MSGILNNIPDGLSLSIGWTIFHSIWIGALISLVLFIALSVNKNGSANLRYNLSVGALLTFLLSCSYVFVKTFLSTSNSPDLEISGLMLNEGIEMIGKISIVDSSSGEIIATTGILEKILSFISRNYSILSLAWLAGIVILFFRFTGGLILSNRIRSSSIIVNDNKLIDLLESLKTKLRINTVIKLAETGIAKVPMVIGSIKPYIIIPAGSLTGVPLEQVEAIILHELAHIKRQDFLVNLIQSLVEIVLFYHPATWWISSNIRNEREMCCDNIVVNNSRETLSYIKALLKLSQQSQSSPVQAVAASGQQKNILNRIKIIAKMKKKGINRIDKITSALMSIVVITGIVLIMGFRSPEEAAPIVTDDLMEVSESFLSTPPLLSIIQEQPATQQDTVRSSGTVHRDFVDPADNKEKEATLTFKNGKLTKLIIEGKTIPESDYGKYSDLVKDTKEDLIEIEEDMEEALEDLEVALEEIEEIDFEEIEAELAEALEEIEEINTEEMMEEIEEDLAEIMEELDEELAELEEIDFEEMQQEIEEALKEVKEFDTQAMMKNIEEEMAQAMEELKNIDMEKIRKEIEQSMKELENIDYEKIRKEMEESMKKIEESLEDMEIDYRKSMENYRENVEKQKKELEKKIREYQDQKKEKKKGPTV